MVDHTHDQSPTILHTVAVLSLTLALLSLVSPQVESLGRGLRTTLPALAISFVAISILSPSSFFRSITRYWLVFLFGILFLMQAALRFVQEDIDASMSWHTYFMGPLIALTFLLWIGAYTELGDKAVCRLRFWLLFGWCTSLALGLPFLITNLGVARLTMGNIHAIENAAKWAPYGVGEYSNYTSLAICLAPLFTFALQRLNGFRRWIALPLVCLAAAAVIASTFAMAAVLLFMSIIAALLIWTRAARGLSRWLRTLVVIGLISMLPLFYSLAKQFPQTEFLTSKLERVYKGVSTRGLEKGDATSRGKLFLADMRGFLEAPLLGYIPHVQGQRDHGHSSLGSSLSLFGVFGFALWGIVMYRIFRDTLRHARSTTEMQGVCIGWLVLIAGGIMNPTWHSSTALSALFALTIYSRKKGVQIREQLDGRM
ncbi:MAG: hypothetical protein HXX11_20730 [Desulfuromonadales bacterium]|nr:hypothetical protein [Desulfuromonadales bacterium]